MKVRELIEILKTKEQEARVIVHGYERGFCDLSKLSKIPIKVDSLKEWYYGPHEEVEPGNEDEIALLIGRIENND